MLAALWAARELRRTGPLRNSWRLLSYGRRPNGCGVRGRSAREFRRLFRCGTPVSFFALLGSSTGLARRRTPASSSYHTTTLLSWGVLPFGSLQNSCLFFHRWGVSPAWSLRNSRVVFFALLESSAGPRLRNSAFYSPTRHDTTRTPVMCITLCDVRHKDEAPEGPRSPSGRSDGARTRNPWDHNPVR